MPHCCATDTILALYLPFRLQSHCFAFALGLTPPPPNLEVGAACGGRRTPAVPFGATSHPLEPISTACRTAWADTCLTRGLCRAAALRPALQPFASDVVDGARLAGLPSDVGPGGCLAAQSTAMFALSGPVPCPQGMCSATQAQTAGGTIGRAR